MPKLLILAILSSNPLDYKHCTTTCQSVRRPSIARHQQLINLFQNNHFTGKTRGYGPQQTSQQKQENSLISSCERTSQRDGGHFPSFMVCSCFHIPNLGELCNG